MSKWGRRSDSRTRRAASRSSPARTAASASPPRASSPAAARPSCSPRARARPSGARAEIEAANTRRGAGPDASSTSPTSTRSAGSPRRSAAELPRDRPARQQRRRDDAAALDDRRRVRAPVRDQPPRALRAHRPPARRPRGAAPTRASSPSPRSSTSRAGSTSTTSSPSAPTRRAAPTSSRSSPTRVFGLELDRRLRGGSVPVKSVLAHPGYSDTNLQSTGPTGLDEGARSRSATSCSRRAPSRARCRRSTRRPTPGVEGGMFIGPDGPFEARGRPTEVKPVRRGARRGDGAAAVGDLRGADRGRLPLVPRRGRSLERRAARRAFRTGRGCPGSASWSPSGPARSRTSSATAPATASAGPRGFRSTARSSSSATLTRSRPCSRRRPTSCSPGVGAGILDADRRSPLGPPARRRRAPLAAQADAAGVPRRADGGAQLADGGSDRARGARPGRATSRSASTSASRRSPSRSSCGPSSASTRARGSTACASG